MDVFQEWVNIGLIHFKITLFKAFKVILEAVIQLQGFYGYFQETEYLVICKTPEVLLPHHFHTDKVRIQSPWNNPLVIFSSLPVISKDALITVV